MKSSFLNNGAISAPSIYQRLFEIGKHLLAQPEIDALLSTAIDNAIKISNAERGMIILFGEQNEILFQAARNLDKEDIEHPKFEISRSIINKVKQNRESVYEKNALENPAFQKSDSVMRLRILSVICLPLMYDDQIFGVVYLDNRKIRGVFKQEIFALIQEFTNFISLAAYSAWERNKLHRRVQNLESELRGRYDFSSIIGTHPAMVEILKLVSQVAETNATILIQGESGTGKELVARAIHYNSNRKDRPFMPINCGAFPEFLLDSELFGHVRGAFTGAVKDHIGWFERADGGTVFLDEVGEMCQPLQVKLLRVLQTGEYSRVGSTEIRHCDVRIVAATNKNLAELVKLGRFRDDLFYRMNVIEIDLPPLRERLCDIPLLIHHFLKKYNAICRKNIDKLSASAEMLLLSYPFPGNVRELENLIQRAVTLAEGNIIETRHFPPRLAEEAPSSAPPEITMTLTETKRRAAEKAERQFIEICLRQTRGHISDAAKLAGMDAGNFHRLMKKHAIEPADFKNPQK